WESIRGIFKRFIVPSIKVILWVIVTDRKVLLCWPEVSLKNHPISQNKSLPQTCLEERKVVLCLYQTDS
ncbi:hypothetical protein, partial [Desulfocastanea catecholica]